MNTALAQNQELSLLDDEVTLKKITRNYTKNKELDQTVNMDHAAANFRYEEHSSEAWNPERYSLLYGTPLWNQATPAQKVLLNQMYWVAYYAQIISAEIATIFFNQTAAAGLYGVEDFRIVCDTLDLESAQERAHINTFKKVSEDLELKVFGKRIFTYPMRSPYVPTMIYRDSNRLKDFWRSLQLRHYAQLSSGNAFIGCQYFTVRGLRTLNGKIVQHQLSKYYMDHKDKANAPIPSKVSYYHFLDESFHFNSSTIISHDILRSLKPPTKFESLVANMTLKGCQSDHFHFSTAINGIFWYDPALFAPVYAMLRSPSFGLDKKAALDMLWSCFCEENEAMTASRQTHVSAIESYKTYLADIDYVSTYNKEMKHMSRNSIARHLATNRSEMKFFIRKVGA